MIRLVTIGLLLIVVGLISSTSADFVCPPDATDDFLPDPNNCEVFYRCTNGQQFRFTCGPGTVFNPSIRNCDWPSAVGCSSGAYKQQKKPKYPDYPQQPNNYQETNYPHGNNLPERHVDPSTVDSGQGNFDNSKQPGQYGGWAVSSSGGSSLPSATGDQDVDPGNSGEQQGTWNNQRPTSSGGVRHQVKPDRQQTRQQHGRKPQDNNYEETNRSPYKKKPENSWDAEDPWKSKDSNRQSPQSYDNENTQTDPIDGQDEIDQRSLSPQGPSPNENNDNGQRNIVTDGKYQWKVPNPDPKKSSKIDWNEMPSKSSTVPTEDVNRVYDDPYPPTNSGSSRPETRQQPSSGRLERPTYPSDNRSYRPQSPSTNPQRGSQDNNDRYNQRRPNQPKYHEEGTTKLPDSPIVYRPSQNRNRDNNNQRNNPRQDNRRYNQPEDREPIWDSQATPSFSKNIEPSPDLARGPNQNKQGYPENGTRNDKNRETNRWVNPKNNRQGQEKHPSSESSENQPFESQRLNPSQRYGKKTDKEIQVADNDDSFNQSQQPGKINRPTKQPTNQWDRNQSPNPSGQDDWNRRPSSSPYGPNKVNQESTDEDPATQTQWYRPKLSPTPTTEIPPYETPLNRPRDNRYRDPNVSTSPYADKRQENRVNPSPRPVYRPDRRQGELRPTPSSNQRQGQNNQRQQVPPNKTNENQWSPDSRPVSPSRQQPQNRQQPDPWGQRKEESFDVQQKEDEQSFESSNIEPRFPDESEVAQVMNDMYVQDPYSIPDLMTNLPCNETTLNDCEKCEKLKWLKLNQVTLKSQPDEAIKTLPNLIVNDCFRRCHSQGCIAYTYNQRKGHCKLFYGPVNEDNIESDSDYVTVIKEPTSALLADQWLYTDHSEPNGKDMGQFNSPDSISCLRACINVGDQCKAISYNSASQLCKIYDSMNGERLVLTGGGISTLQHISIHNKGDAWRFSPMGTRKFNTSIPIMSFAISEDQECYEECLNTQGCLAISIEGKSPKECHIYNKLDTLSDESSLETPSSSSSSSSQINTYLVKIPTNSSHFLQLPGLYFSGKPLKKFEQFNLKDCQEVVKSIPTAIKITYLKESQICYIFSDAAKIGLWKNPEIEAISFLVNLPADPKYLAYKRLTGLTLTHALLAPKGEKHLGTQSAAACLDNCLKTENCSAVAVTYSDIQDSVECILLKEDELSGKPRFVFKEDTDLFVRTLPANLVPELGEKDDQCSLRINVPSANDNLPYFEREKSKKQSEPNLLEKAEQLLNKANPFHNSEKKSGQLRESKRLDDDDEVLNDMIPHGLEFEGMIEKLEDDESLDSFVENGQRSKRSIYAMTLRGAQVYDETIEQNQNKNPLEAGAEAGFAVRDLLSGSLGISDNNSTENILLSRFLKRAQDVSQNPRLSEDIISSIKSSARKVRSNDGEETKEETRKPCKITKGSTIKEIKCRPEEICSNVPYIVHGDQKAMTNCSGTRVNSTCLVTCKSGYRSSKGRLVCEIIGSTPTWNTKDISCVPDDSMCSELPWIPFTTIKSTSDGKNLNYLIKYDEGKKLPLFGVYKFTPSTNDNNQQSQLTAATRSKRSADDSIVALPCSQLKLNQLSNMNYKQTNYTKGYLVPPSAFPINSDGRKLVNYFVNTAPQDSYTSQGPWSLLTDTIHGYLKLTNQSGFIINGVCNQQIYSPSTSSLPVPKCFWKTVCTRTQTGQVTSATFYHDNQPINQDDQSNQKKRFDEIFSYTNPEFVKSLIGIKDYDSLWPEILDRFSTSSSKTVQDEMMILQCAASNKIDPKLTDFWNTLLLNGTDGSSDSLSQSDDLTTSESQSSPIWTQKLTESSQFSPSSPSASSANCDKKLIGYIGLNGDTINLTAISSSSITHLTLMGAVKINENGSLSLGNDTKKIYDRLYELKSLKNDNPEIKVLIALGGWTNSQWFTKISRSPNVQKTFIMDIIAFLDYWQFDGVDIVWQYPNIGGKVKGSKEDKDNLNRLMQNIKDSMIDHQSRNGQSEPYSLVLTGPGLYWILDYGYDLKTLINHLDWINIMAFDFHGPWNSSWGDYTGPMSPLYFGSPDGFPGKLNIDAIIKRYACETGRPDKLVLGLGFFGRAWTNVGNHVDESKDDLFRKASPVKDGSKGSMISYRKLSQEWLTKGEPVWHNKTRTSFLWNRMKRSLVSFESEDSLKEKVAYADAKGLGGLMVWSLDMDDAEGTLIKSIGGGLKCNNGKKSSPSDTFKCNPLVGEKRHWTQYDDNGTKDRLCGKRAPLINGYYPICDPDDPGYSCCSSSGYCGSGPAYCECEGCIDYGANPERALNDSTVPSSPSITWLTTDLIDDIGKPDCGLNAQKAVNGSSPICNPEDPKKHCCSSTGFCGTGPDYCECKGCINFNTNSSHIFPEKNWFDWSDGPENAGRCGPQAPRIKGRIAGCDPTSETAHCCGPNGYCGTGPDYCSCKECINFTSKPVHDWS